MNYTAIRDRLIERGKAYFAESSGTVLFTKDKPADDLLNDLDRHPHAFVIACIMDRQVKAERAWALPCLLSQRLGGFSFTTLAALGEEQIETLMTEPEPLHRFPNVMAKNLGAAIRLIAEKYNGDAAAIWRDRPSSAEVVYRFLEFQGVGPKIATMAANILARDFKIPFSDYYSIDISVDRQVRRVFERLGLVPQQASLEVLIYRARAMHPEFPGVLDYPAWEIGRQWCRPTECHCADCHMHSVCPQVNT